MCCTACGRTTAHATRRRDRDAVPPPVPAEAPRGAHYARGVPVVTTTTTPTGGEASVELDRPPGELWPMVADPTLLGRYSDENNGGKWLGGARAAALGARFRGYNRRGMARWWTDCEITEFIPEQVIAFRVQSPPGAIHTTWAFRLETTGDGARLTHSWSAPKPFTTGRRGFFRLAFGTRDRAGDLTRNAATTLGRLAAEATGTAPA
jgi:uncharacterized protein YndB with AHSA1/START domain